MAQRYRNTARWERWIQRDLSSSADDMQTLVKDKAGLIREIEEIRFYEDLNLERYNHRLRMLQEALDVEKANNKTQAEVFEHKERIEKLEKDVVSLVQKKDTHFLLEARLEKLEGTFFGQKMKDVEQKAKDDEQKAKDEKRELAKKDGLEKVLETMVAMI